MSVAVSLDRARQAKRQSRSAGQTAKCPCVGPAFVLCLAIRLPPPFPKNTRQIFRITSCKTHRFQLLSQLPDKNRFWVNPKIGLFIPLLTGVCVVTRSVFTGKYERFRQLIVQARKDAGLTQVQLARKLGKPQSYVSKYELGERRLDVIEFVEVAVALGARPETLLKRLRVHPAADRV